MCLYSRILLPGSSASPQRSGYSSNAGSPSNPPSSAPALQGKRASLCQCVTVGGQVGRGGQLLSCTSTCSTVETCFWSKPAQRHIPQLGYGPGADEFQANV